MHQETAFHHQRQDYHFQRLSSTTSEHLFNPTVKDFHTTSHWELNGLSLNANPFEIK